MGSSAPNTGWKTLFPCCIFLGCSRGPADEAPVGSSSLLSVSSSAGCLGVCISYDSVHFFLSWLETRRMFLSRYLHYYKITQQSAVVAGNDKCNFATSAL